MAVIDARIPLAGRNIGGLGQALESGREDKRRRELFDFAKEDRTREIERQQQADVLAGQEREQTRRAEADRQNLESVVIGAVEVKPLLDNIEGIPRAVSALTRRIEEIDQRGGDSADSREVLEMIQAGRIDQARASVDSAIQAGQAQGLITPQGGVTAGTAERFFESQIAGLPPEEQAQARRVQLGLEPRAGISARERIAADPDITEQVAASEADIAQRKKFAELTGASRAKVVDKGVEEIQKIDVNTRNLGKAIAAIDEGATTGAIVSRFTPTVRAATVKLEQVQKLLGLDVIGAVTFGALSQGELDLALATALPVMRPVTILTMASIYTIPVTIALPAMRSVTTITMASIYTIPVTTVSPTITRVTITVAVSISSLPVTTKSILIIL